jgi:hypothetical protein
MIKINEFTVARTAMLLLALGSLGSATTFTYQTDPFQGTTVRNTPGRQVVGGELFLNFFTATDIFAFDETAFGMGNQVHFANGFSNTIPSTGVNVVVLEDLDNDNNPLTPFGAGNAADLLASRITTPGPGVFVYFNQSLNLPRLVYSDDLSSNSADLRILARMLNLMGPTGTNALPNFTASNFAITGTQTVPEPSGIALMCGGIILLALPAARRLANRRTVGMVAVLLLAAVARAGDFAYTNIVDTTGGFVSFGSMPAISNSGAVAFIGTGAGYESGAVLRWQGNRLTVIASKAAGGLTTFGDTLILNSEGVVGFGAKVLANNDTIIATGNGGPVRVMASAAQHGLVGGGFLGIGGMNESGQVVFLAFRKSFVSQAVFRGQGGPPTPVVDTATDMDFVGFGNADIDASGRVAFIGFRNDNDVIFTASHGLTTQVFASSGFTFLDPVINNSGTVASATFPGSGGAEVFTVRGDKFTVVTDPATSGFTLADNVSINDSGDVAFFANEANGRDGIFVKGNEDRKSVPVIETGDRLFGSNVNHVSVGRYSLNDRGQVVFLYGLTDGRSGLAIASQNGGRDR